MRGRAGSLVRALRGIRSPAARVRDHAAVCQQLTCVAWVRDHRPCQRHHKRAGGSVRNQPTGVHEPKPAAAWSGMLRLPLLGRRVLIDLPHLALLAAIVAFCVWYLEDAREASLDIQNLLLIQPAALLALVFAACILREIVVIAPASEATSAPESFVRPALPKASGFKIAGSMVLLGLYVGAIGTIGFDVATALY